MADELLRLKDVADRLGIPFTHATRLVRSGRLMAVKRPAGPATWRVEQTALDVYIVRRRKELEALDQRRREKAIATLVSEVKGLDSVAWGVIDGELGPRWASLLRSCSTDASRPEELISLVGAYRSLSDAGHVELQMAIPRSLYSALGGLAYAEFVARG